MVDVLGLVLALRLTSANVAERADALVLFGALGQRFTRLKTILADQGFDGVDFLAKVKATYQLTVDVVRGVLGRSRVRVKGFQMLPKRWIVEPVRRCGTFGWWAFHHRLAKDYEVKESHAEAVIYWTMIRLMSRKIRETQS